MRRRIAIGGACLALLAGTAVAVAAGPQFNNAQPQTYDPAKTDLASTGWVNGIGCPTGQPVAEYPSTKPTGTYTDPACPSGDSKDHNNQGLLMNKVGPSSNNAAAQVELKELKGQPINELGYDLRKVNERNGPNGSQCDVQAPAWEIEASDGHTYFIGCTNSGATVTGGTPPSSAWLRFRWGGSNPIPANDENNGYAEVPDIRGLTIKKAQLVYYSGSDQGPTYFGAAIVDNIDVNGTLVGHGSKGDL